MNKILVLAVLGGCYEGPALEPDVEWARGAAVPMDASWRGGATPAELIARVDGLAGTWIGGPVQDVNAEPIADLTLTVAGSEAAEYACTSDAGACAEERLAITTNITLAGPAFEWSGSDVLFCYFPENDELGFCDFEVERELATHLVGSEPVELADEEPCSDDVSLLVRGAIPQVNAELVARCADGTDQALVFGYWQPVE